MDTAVVAHRKGGYAVSLLRIIVTCVLLTVLVSGCSTDDPPMVTLGGVDVQVLLADEDAERSRGLQGYEPLPEGEGMLFVYDEAAVRTFAMKQVSFPIDVLFVGEDLTVASIEPLDPGDTRLVSSPGPCRYVIELPQGWAEEQGIAVGDAFVYARER